MCVLRLETVTLSSIFVLIAAIRRITHLTLPYPTLPYHAPPYSIVPWCALSIPRVDPPCLMEQDLFQHAIVQSGGHMHHILPLSLVTPTIDF